MMGNTNERQSELIRPRDSIKNPMSAFCFFNRNIGMKKYQNMRFTLKVKALRKDWRNMNPSEQ